MTTTAVHPRYVGAWEPKPDDWTDQEWGVPEPWMHDLVDHRWLLPEHATALAAGTLDVPGMHRVTHAAVLVSAQDSGYGTPVSWVDRGVAELVFLAARLGIGLSESCEDGWGGPTIWFRSGRAAMKFALIVGSNRIDGRAVLIPSERLRLAADRLRAAL